MYQTSLLFLSLLTVCYSVTINIQTGIIGPWRQITVNSKHISSNIVKRGFVSKLYFEEDEEIEEDEQIESITKLTGLTEFEMKSVGQLKVPLFKDLKFIKTMKLSGNQFSYIDDKSFSQITPVYIDLSRNHINKIEDNAFGDKLETLIINCNDLTTVSSTWFQETDALQSLQLRGNKITVIPDNFKVFNNLWELHINYNKLHEIKDGALSQKRYTYLDVSYNNLTEIKSTYFSAKKVEINYLNLRANRLNYLPPDFMSKATVTVELTADLNPWLCPCNDLIRKWLPNIVLYNKKNSWLDAQAEQHAHRNDAFCIYDDAGSRTCPNAIDSESTEYYLKEIEPFDTEACPEF